MIEVIPNPCYYNRGLFVIEEAKEEEEAAAAMEMEAAAKGNNPQSAVWIQPGDNDGVDHGIGNMCANTIFCCLKHAATAENVSSP